MKLLCCVDVHGDKRTLENIVYMSKYVDLVVCAGDLTNFEHNMKSLLKKLNTSKKKVLIIPGNHETPESLKKACKEFNNLIYLHKKHYVFKGVLFLGYGTGGFSMRDPEFVKTTSNFKKIIKKHKGLPIVLITHAPPYGTKADFINGAHVGNKDIRKFIVKNNVLLSISGHLHETAGVVDRIRKTTVINPGVFMIVEI